MARNWEVFTNQKAKSAVKVLRVSLNTRGVFALNQLAYDALKQPKTVELLFDKTAKVVGLKPSEARDSNLFPVRQQGKNKSYVISAKSFCTYYDIDVSKTVIFNDVEIENKIMVLDLSKTTDLVWRAKSNT